MTAIRRFVPVLLFASAASLLLPAATQAQTRLRGTVQEVHYDRVRVELDDRMVPPVGDSAVMGQQVPGLGRVRSAGAWRVSAVDSDAVWLIPDADTPPATPGGWV